MPFVVDDIAIAAAIAAAEAAAAEAATAAAATAAAQAAAGGAGAAASAGGAAGAAAGGEAAGGLAASQAAEAAAGQAATQAATTGASQAATTGATQAAATGAADAGATGIADAMANSAAGLEQGIMAEVLPQGAMEGAMNFAPEAVNAAVPSAVEAAVPSAVEAAVPAAVEAAVPAAEAAMPALEAAVEIAPQTVAEVAAETAPAAEATLGETLSGMADKVGSAMTSKEFLIPLALQGASALMSNSAYDNAGDYTEEALDTSTGNVKKEEARSNKAVEDWGSNYLSPDAMKKNQDDAYAKLAADYVSNQDRAKQELGGITGATPDEYSKAMAGASANSSQDAADYARKLAKAQAPAFADLGTNIGEMKANRETSDALSNMKTAGAEGYNALGSVPGDPKLLTAAALRGLGGGLSTILGK